MFFFEKSFSLFESDYCGSIRFELGLFKSYDTALKNN
jgi:hypothetical protein